MTKRTDADTTRDEDDLTADPATHWRQVEQRHYDPDRDRGLTTAIVFAIAAAKGVDPVELKSPPLYEVVDAAALEDTFFGPSVSRASRQGVGTVEFRYDDVLVKVRSDGWVQVYEAVETDLS